MKNKIMQIDNGFSNVIASICKNAKQSKFNKIYLKKLNFINSRLLHYRSQ